MPFKEDDQLNKRNQQTEDTISESDKEIIDMDFLSGRMLYQDVLNFWSTVMIKTRMLEKASSDGEKQEHLNELSPIPRYEQGYRDAGEKDAKISYIIKLSDPEQIKKYNELVDEFNADLNCIKNEKDNDSLRKYFKRVKEIVEEIK